MKTVAAVTLALALLLPSAAPGEVVTKTIAYRAGEVELEGYAAWDDSLPGKLPGVLVVHDWMGVSAVTRQVADRLAALGYYAFCADIYGKGVRPANREEASKTAGIYRADRPLMRARARAGLDALLASGKVEPSRVAASGYCFGGGVVLELARSGAPLAATVVFHGSLDTPTPQDAANIKGKVLAMQGGDDPGVPAEVVAAWVKEMREGKVDWELVQYGGTVHSFTNPGAGNDPSRGSAYNAQSDRRSWERMESFLREVLGR